ncbi:MAG: glycoside hydrolase family 2 [Ruminococcaceae bacterium]|nr:glycoside hydrolase family 2 [Oscillospiraceae bacterium]
MSVNFLKSRFYDEVGEKPLVEYPRPQLVRDSYLNLNGKWEYAIRPIDGNVGDSYDGEILVPFSPECLLSGVMRKVTPKDKLFYKTVFKIPGEFINEITLLHFTAVDYACTVILNGQIVGSHTGGFFPFSFDVSSFIESGENELLVEVTDPSDTGIQAKGKQKNDPNTIWYTPQSGIWGTVWMESVTDDYIKSLKIVPNIDKNLVTISASTEAASIDVEIFDGEKLFAKGFGKDKVEIVLDHYELWSPEHPKLYKLKIKAGKDVVESYFGMRKFDVGPDENGIQRLLLNNKPYFHNGVLDQGYWSDGMLTPPTDSAMIYDIEMLKSMGFNMIRKHIKIEPLRWYYHCDRLGMLVWQDMVNGGGKYNLCCIAIMPFIGFESDDTTNRKFFARESEEGRIEYERDLVCTVELLINQVGLCMWVPFNEGWGQFDSKRITKKIYDMDSTRTIDSTSGWHDQGGGDFVSKHIYFTPIYVPKDERCYLLSEFGGYSMPVKGHTYKDATLFGYHMYCDEKCLKKAYKKLYERKIIPNIPKGLSAAVYTQLSDIEGEVNGFITYDRMVEKMERSFVRKINEKVKL